MKNVAIVSIALIVIAVLAFTLGGVPDLIGGYVAGQQAALAAARADEARARAQLVVNSAAAYAVRTDAQQTWIIPVALGAVIGLLLIILALQAWRVVSAERAFRKNIYGSLTEEDRRILSAELTRLYQRRPQQTAPDVRGRLAFFEQSAEEHNGNRW